MSAYMGAKASLDSSQYTFPSYAASCWTSGSSCLSILMLTAWEIAMIAQVGRATGSWQRQLVADLFQYSETGYSSLREGLVLKEDL